MGFYTQIHDVNAPKSAKYGDRVFISFWVKNTYPDSVWLATTLYANGVLQVTSPDEYFAAPGQDVYFECALTMPDVSSLEVQIDSYYWTGEWVDDDRVYLTIARTMNPQISGFKISDFNKV